VTNSSQVLEACGKADAEYGTKHGQHLELEPGACNVKRFEKLFLPEIESLAEAR
jgi:hypothetical protein